MAVLLGGVAFPVPRHTDLPALSGNLDDVLPEFMPPNSTNRETTVSGSLVYRTLTPITKVTLSTRLIENFVQDYYYRVHVTPAIIALGNILSSVTKTVNIWSAYFGTNELLSTDDSGLNGAIATINPAAPTTYSALEDRDITIDIPEQGPADASGKLVLSFARGYAEVVISGSRVIIWPFIYSDTFTETRQWVTSVLRAYSAENREVVRDIPRTKLGFNYRFKTQDEYTFAKTLASKASHVTLGLPLWRQVTTMRDLPINMTSLELDLTEIELQVNQSIIFLTNYTKYETATVLSIVGNVITLKEGLTQRYDKAFVAPVSVGLATEGISLGLSKQHQFSGSLNITDLTPFNLGQWSFTSYLTHPTLLDNSLLQGTLKHTYGRDQEVVDNVTGNRQVIDQEDYSRKRFSWSTKTKTRKELYNLKRMLDVMQGRFKAFWVPSYIDDFKVTDTSTEITALSSSIDIKGNFVLNPPTYIQVVGDIQDNFKVTNAVSIADGTRLTLDPPAPNTISNIKYISILTLVRSGGDEMNIRHNGITATLTIPLIEVKV